jgi:CheY-like chemotaxis protein
MNRPRLLCVDDDRGIRELYQLVLGSYGYEVLVAGSGPQALQLFRSKDKPIDAVISDYEMPGMNGAELATEIKRFRPGVPVVLVSGYQAVLEEAPNFVDAAIAKGAPIGEMIDQIELLLTPSKTLQYTPRTLSQLVPLGSALASVALGAYLIPRILR